MNWTMDIQTADWDLLVAKAIKDKTTEDAMLKIIVNRYLADVKRESGADIDSNISKRLAEMTDVQKVALAAQLEVA